jgi:hypothetical protein
MEPSSRSAKASHKAEAEPGKEGTTLKPERSRSARTHEQGKEGEKRVRR